MIRRLLLALSLAVPLVCMGGDVTGPVAPQAVPYSTSASTPANGNCLMFSGSPPTGFWQAGSCSGSSSTAFANLTGGTNTTAAMLVGTGATLGVTGSGTIAATTAANLASYPTLCTGGQFSQGLSGGSNNCATPSGSGTVTDGSGTSTANEMLVSTTTAHTYSLVTPNSTALNLFQVTSAITVSGCTPSASTLGVGTGIVTQPATPCTTATFTFNGGTAVTGVHGWICTMGDQTQEGTAFIPTWYQSSSTTTTCTVPIPPAAQTASDVLWLNATAY